MTYNSIHVGLEPRKEAIFSAHVGSRFIFTSSFSLRAILKSALRCFRHGPPPASESLSSFSDSLNAAIEPDSAEVVPTGTTVFILHCVCLPVPSRKGVASSPSSPPIGRYPHGMTPFSVGCPGLRGVAVMPSDVIAARHTLVYRTRKTPQVSNRNCRRAGVGWPWMGVQTIEIERGRNKTLSCDIADHLQPRCEMRHIWPAWLSTMLSTRHGWMKEQ
jgi:hypothetical protein